MRLDNPSIAEHAEVFGHLWLANPKLFGDFAYRARPITQELDNMHSVRFGKSAQRRQHVSNIPQPVYACQGI
jgi:hypothetical protein